LELTATVIVCIPLLSIVMDPVKAGGLLAPLFIAMDMSWTSASFIGRAMDC
jgi:hypothetical protein